MGSKFHFRSQKIVSLNIVIMNDIFFVFNLSNISKPKTIENISQLTEILLFLKKKLNSDNAFHRSEKLSQHTLVYVGRM